MVTPDEEHDQYVKDPRTTCKFGVGCYQKNPLHHQKYKHPPKKRAATEDKKYSDQARSKKLKPNGENEGQSSTVKISNDISESDQSTDEETKVEDKRPGKEQEAHEESSSASSNSEESSAEHLRRNKVEDEHPRKEKETREESSSTSSTSEENSAIHLQKTPADFDKKAFIKEKFLVDMPEDFYLFWDFCKSLNSNNPANAFASAGLTLVGPYDVLADKFSNVEDKSPEEYLVHWRYYCDPPEFQTVIKGSDATGYHIGYFRDDPSEPPVFVASNHAKKDGEISCMGANIFAAVSLFLEETKKSCDPFKKMSVTKLQSAVKNKAEKLNVDLSEKAANIKERSHKILVRSFNKAGLIVPYNRKTQVGYRHLCISDKELKKLLDRVVNASDQQRDKVMSELQPVLTATSIATDECDFGTSVELGWDILAHGVDFLNSTIERYLTTAYQLLQRQTFAKIATAHMKNRRKGTSLSIL